MRKLLLLVVVLATLATLASAGLHKKLMKLLILSQLKPQLGQKYIVVPLPVPFGLPKGLVRKGHELLDTLSHASAPNKKAQILIHTTTGLGSGLGSSGGWGDNQAVFLR